MNRFSTFVPAAAATPPRYRKRVFSYSRCVSAFSDYAARFARRILMC